MIQLMRYAFTLVFLVALSSVAMSVQVLDPMADFYNGLADVVDRNVDSPDVCVAKAEDYIRRNLPPLQQAAERGRQQAQAGHYQQLSEKEMRAKMEEKGGTRMLGSGVKALNRFMESIQRLSSKYPGHAEKIMDLLSRYSPDDDDR